MIDCIFNDLDPILLQLKDYCLSFMTTGTCVVQINQISLVCTPLEVAYFEYNRCSDIELIQPSNFDGNHVYYKYKDIDIVIYKLENI